MILTNCAACAAPLAHNAPRCVRCQDSGATLDDLREAVETSEEIERTARRVFGGTHPTAKEMENVLKRARAALRAREAGKRLVFVEPT